VRQSISKRFRDWSAGTIALLSLHAVGLTPVAFAVELPLEQYIDLDDGRYELQADGTYSKVGGYRPPSPANTHNHTHNHTQLPSSGGQVIPSRPRQNEKYLRLDDGLYVLQSDGTYAKADSVAPGPQRPVTPNYRPNANIQPWQNNGRVRPNSQNEGYVDDEGRRWVRQFNERVPQPQWQPNPNQIRPQPQWVDNNTSQRLPPGRRPNNQDDSDLQNNRFTAEASPSEQQQEKQRIRDIERGLENIVRELIRP